LDKTCTVLDDRTPKEEAMEHIARRSTVATAGSRGLFLLAAAVALVLSVTLWFTGNHEQGVFVGLWVPSVLSLGAFMAPR
jgi:hypothetical protein